MAIQVTCVKVDDTLFATLEGSYDSKADDAADRQVASACRDHDCQKVLIDMTGVDGLPSVVDLFRSSTSLADRGFHRRMKIAFLDRIEFKDANEFYELVARNRGFLKMRHFYEKDVALEWLSDSE